MNLEIGYNSCYGGESVYPCGRYYIYNKDANEYLSHNLTFNKMMGKNYRGDGYYHSWSAANAAIQDYKDKMAVQAVPNRDKLLELINKYAVDFGVAVLTLHPEDMKKSVGSLTNIKNFLNEVKF